MKIKSIFLLLSVIIPLYVLVMLFALSFVRKLSTNDYRSYIAHWEGYRNRVYLDSRGNKTVGIGHLLPPDCTEHYFSHAQIEAFYNEDFNTAYNCAIKLYPHFQNLPHKVQLVLVDMEFNLGDAKLRQFVKFNRAINEGDFYLAVWELEHSKWYSQTGRRAQEHCAALEYCSSFNRF